MIVIMIQKLYLNNGSKRTRSVLCKVQDLGALAVKSWPDAWKGSSWIGASSQGGGTQGVSIQEGTQRHTL
eukprot:1157254-Pelagomonas_calceolata.AAC.2